MARKTASESILRETPGRSAKVHVQSDSRFKVLKYASVLSVALIVGICIILNLIVDSLLDKPLTFDATSVKANSVSVLTKNYLDSLDKKVEIYGLFDKDDKNFALREYFLPIMDDYENKANGKIELKYVDPDVDPFILTELDPNNVYSLRKYTYVIKSDDLMVTLDPYNCFVWNSNLAYNYNLYVPEKNLVEQKVTGLILYVASGRTMKAYYLGGHGLKGHGALDMIISPLGMVSSELSLKGENVQIPSDCEILMIIDPDTDLTITEKELIKTYLDDGGKVLLVSDFDTDKVVEMPNLNEITKKMGITLESAIIHENSADALPDVNNPYSSIAFADPDYANYLSVPDKYSVENCRYLKVNSDRGENIFVSPLIITSSSASVDFPNTQIDSSVSSGQQAVALQSVDTTNNRNSCLIVIGSNTFVSDEYYSEKSLNDNNAVFTRNMLGDICQIEISVLAPVKSVPSFSLSKPLSSSAATAWSICVMTIIPLGSLICGVYIYRKRRHL